MTSGTILPPEVRLSSIDESNIGDHSHLTGEDVCYYLFEYTSGQNYAFSKTNGLISNLKKKPSQRHLPHYAYKARAITEAADCMAQALNPNWTGLLVPTPPSKAKNDPDYDDRIIQVCRRIMPDRTVELVEQKATIRAAHEGIDRPSPEELYANYRVNQALLSTRPTSFAVVDDVLSAGAHFVAMKRALGQTYPGIKVFGLFIARRVFSEPDVSKFFNSVEF